MRESRWTLGALLALTIGAAAGGCEGEDVATVRIERLDAPGPVAGLEWRPADSTLVATIEGALRDCSQQEMIKFRPSHRVVVRRKAGAESAVLVLGDVVKIDGVAFRCSQDIEALIDRLWREGTERR